MIVVSVNQYRRTESVTSRCHQTALRSTFTGDGGGDDRPYVVTESRSRPSAGFRGSAGGKGGERTKTVNTVRAFPRPGSTTPSCDTYSGPWSRTYSAITIIVYYYYYYYKLPYNIPNAFRNNSARAARPSQSVTAVMVFYSIVYNVPSYYYIL